VHLVRAGSLKGAGRGRDGLHGRQARKV
jgi:hypothetical protein